MFETADCVVEKCWKRHLNNPSQKEFQPLTNSEHCEPAKLLTFCPEKGGEREAKAMFN